MRLEAPVPFADEDYTFNGRDIEPLLQGFPLDMKPSAATTRPHTGEEM